jgi:hypothetical protein
MTDAPDKHHEFFAVDGDGNRMFGTENADAAFGLIEVEDDGDGFVDAWNENSRRVIEFAVAAQPSTVLALIDRVEKAEAAHEETADKLHTWIRMCASADEKNIRLRALLARAGEELRSTIDLAWVDTREVRFDQTILFGIGYDFDPWEAAREELHCAAGSFAVWPSQIGGNAKWSAYGGPDNTLWFERFATKQQAKDAVLNEVSAICPQFPTVTARTVAVEIEKEIGRD